MVVYPNALQQDLQASILRIPSISQAEWHIYVASLANDGSTLALNPEGGIFKQL